MSPEVTCSTPVIGIGYFPDCRVPLETTIGRLPSAWSYHQGDFAVIKPSPKGQKPDPVIEIQTMYEGINPLGGDARFSRDFLQVWRAASGGQADGEIAHWHLNLFPEFRPDKSSRYLLNLLPQDAQSDFQSEQKGAGVTCLVSSDAGLNLIYKTVPLFNIGNGLVGVNPILVGDRAGSLDATDTSWQDHGSIYFRTDFTQVPYTFEIVVASYDRRQNFKSTGTLRKIYEVAGVEFTSLRDWEIQDEIRHLIASGQRDLRNFREVVNVYTRIEGVW